MQLAANLHVLIEDRYIPAQAEQLDGTLAYVDAIAPLGAREVGAREVGVREVCAREVGAREVGDREVGERELGALEVGAREVGAREVGVREVGALEVGAREAGVREVGARINRLLKRVPGAQAAFYCLRNFVLEQYFVCVSMLDLV